MSIIPRGQALGVTLSAPEADRFNYDDRYLRAKLRVLLGGRVAEELVFGTITTGAENDIREATALARHMVGAWGMSEAIGPMSVLPDADAAQAPWAQPTSADTQRLLDAESRRLIDEARRDVTGLLSEHRDQLEALVAALLAHETLDEPDAYAAAGLPVRAGASVPAPS